MASAMNATIPQPSPAWPAWYYGPDDQAEIFQSPEEVPEGWMSNPDFYRRTRDEKESPDADEVGQADASPDEKGLQEEVAPRRRGRPPKIREEQF